MDKYIKVTEKDQKPIVVLASNKTFFLSRKAKIEEPTPEEIEEFFPQEKQKVEQEKSEKEQLSIALEEEKNNHNQTKNLLREAIEKIDLLEKEILELKEKKQKQSKDKPDETI